MDKTIKTITEVSKSYQDRSVWDKFQTGSRASQRFDAYRNASPKSKQSWLTTNSEYGRFQSWRPSGSQVDSMSKSGDFSPVEQVKTSVLENRKSSNQLVSRRSTAGIKLPPIEDRLIGSKPKPSALYQEEAPQMAKKRLSPSLGMSQPSSRKRLTTGVAKHYMMNECSRFWQNMQTVAEDAGLDLCTRGGSVPSRADVLTIPEREDSGSVFGEGEDDTYSHSVPSIDGTPPMSPKNDRKD